jgi:restriction system protein
MVSFKEAALCVLEKADEPLSTKEVTDIAIQDGLIKTEGQTPEASMGAQLYLDIKNNKNSPFLKVGKGLFSLKRHEASSSPFILIEKQNDIVKKELKGKLHDLDPYLFEFLVGDLLQKIGYEDVEVTKRSGDGGIDINAYLTVGGITNVKTVIQVKRYRKKITGKVIRELRGSAEVDQRGLIITTSDFTKDALIESKAPNKMPVALVNGEN